MLNPNLNVQNNPKNLGMEYIMNENYIKNNNNNNNMSNIQPNFNNAPTYSGSSRSGSSRSGSSISGSSVSSSRTGSSISKRSRHTKHTRDREKHITPDDSISSSGTKSISSNSSNSSYEQRYKYEKMPREKLIRKKRELLYKFERLDKRSGYTHNYNMDSDYVEMKREYDRIINDKSIDASVKFQRKALVAFVSGIEFMNGKFDPVGAKLDGWSESISEDIDSYDDIFEELYDKYKGKSSMPPEMRLIFSLVSSGVLYHVTNSIFSGYKQQMPDIEKVLNNNPELKKQFAAATAKEMGSDQKEQGNPFGGGLMGMMGNILGSGGKNTGSLDIGGLMQNLGGMMMQNPSQQPSQHPSQQPSQKQQYNAPQRNNVPPPQNNFNNIMKDINNRIDMEIQSMSELTDGSGSMSIMSNNISIAGESDVPHKSMIGKKMMSMN
jgi:hypothetical protein